MLKVGIIGAGRVGCALAIALKQKGLVISGVYSKSAESFDFLSKKIYVDCENSLTQVVKGSDVIILTVPDDAIGALSYDIAQKSGVIAVKSKIFMHCSGALSSDVLENLRLIGAYTGSLHPIQTFADRENGWKDVENIYFGFEGCKEAQKCAEALVKALKADMLIIEKKNKPLYHAAACILSNYMVTLTYIAGEVLEKAGVASNKGMKAFMPLLKNTVKNIECIGSVKALTGPVCRGDVEVIRTHINELNDVIPEVSGLYKVLGLATVDVALKKASIDEVKVEELKSIFCKSL